MISFEVDDHRFDLRAAAIIVHDGRILLHRLPADPYWSLPGGRIEAGEQAAHAVTRELREEIGEDIIVGRLLAVLENFFSYGGRPRHEIGLYFEATLPEASPYLANARFVGAEAGEELIFEWFARDAIVDTDVRPAALKRLLCCPKDAVDHLVNID